MPPHKPGTDAFEFQTLIRMLEMKSPTVTIRFHVKDVLVMISQLQLALRHPQNRGRGAAVGYAVQGWLTGFLDAIQPGIGMHLAKGAPPVKQHSKDNGHDAALIQLPQGVRENNDENGSPPDKGRAHGADDPGLETSSDGAE